LIERQITTFFPREKCILRKSKGAEREGIADDSDYDVVGVIEGQLWLGARLLVRRELADSVLTTWAGPISRTGLKRRSA
jgi:hypothetical protein